MNTTTFFSSSPSYDGEGFYTGPSVTFDGDNYNDYFGDYVEIELPQRIYLMAVELWPRQSEETAYRPTKFAVFGCTGSDSWSMLLQVEAPQWRSNGSTTWNISETTQRYKHFRLAVDEITQGTAGSSFQVAEIVLHGHEHRLYEFPPGPMTGATTTFGSDYSVGAGEYSISSSIFSPSSPELTLIAFDRSIGTVFVSGFYFDVSTGHHDCSTQTYLATGVYVCGESLSILFPVEVFVSTIELRPGLTDFETHSPFDWYLLGGSSLDSDEQPWSVLYEETDYTSWRNESRTIAVEAGIAFSAFRLLVSRVDPDMNDGFFELAEFRLFGYTADDGVTKFPPVPLTDAVQSITDVDFGEGTYAVNASSALYNDYTAVGAFDNDWSTFYHSEASLYDMIAGDYIGQQTTITVDGQSYNGEFVDIQLPVLAQMTSVQIVPRRDGFYQCHSPRDWFLLGSNDEGAEWHLLHNEISVWDTEDLQSFNFTNTVAFDTFRLLVTRVGDDDCFGDAESLQIAELSYWGYDVLNRPYPPTSLSNTPLLATGFPYGNGRYVVGVSSVLQSATAAAAFDLSPDTAFVSMALYAETSGAYEGTAQTVFTEPSSGNTSIYAGEYVELELPVKLVVRTVELTPTASFDVSAPSAWALFGSLDGVSFSHIASHSMVWESTTTVSVTVNAADAYIIFRFSCTTAGNGNLAHATKRSLGIAEFVLYGYELINDTPAIT
eukprot:gene17029-12188_t